MADIKKVNDPRHWGGGGGFKRKLLFLARQHSFCVGAPRREEELYVSVLEWYVLFRYAIILYKYVSKGF